MWQHFPCYIVTMKMFGFRPENTQIANRQNFIYVSIHFSILKPENTHLSTTNMTKNMTVDIKINDQRYKK